MQEQLRAIGFYILFVQLDGFAGLHDPFMMFHPGGGILGCQPHIALFRRFEGGNFHGCFAQKILRLHVFDPAELGVDQNKAAFPVFAKNSHGQLFQQRVIKRLRFPQRLHHLFHFRDVPADADQTHDGSLLVPQRHLGGLQPAFLAGAGIHRWFLPIQRLARFHH